MADFEKEVSSVKSDPLSKEAHIPGYADRSLVKKKAPEMKMPEANVLFSRSNGYNYTRGH